MLARLSLCALMLGCSVLAQTPTLGDVNKELPGWLRFSGEERARLEGFWGGGFVAGNNDAYFLNRIRFDMAIIPASWLKFRFETQDAREWWKNQTPAPPFQDTWDLRQAYMELGDTENGAAALRVGRQGLAFGEERLLGNSNWQNTARSFDAVRGTLRRGKFRLDVFAASVVVLHDGQVGEPVGGNNIHGLYGGMNGLIPSSVIEPYLFWRLSRGVHTEEGGLGSLDSKTAGVRWVGKLPQGFDYNIDVAVQRGSIGPDRIAAWAGHWVAGRTFTARSWKPRVMAEYNHATGDSNPRDGKVGTFDQLYPTAHDKYGLADQVGWKNIHHVRGGIELQPAPKRAASTKYSGYWLADPHDALYNTSSVALARSVDGTAGRFVGQQIDGTAAYTLSKEIQTGGGIAHLFQGTFLKNTTPHHGYTSPYLFLDYNF